MNWRGVVVVAVVVIGVAYLAHESPRSQQDSAVSSGGASPLAAPAGFRRIGGQGILHFVVMDTAHYFAPSTIMDAAREICGTRPVCWVAFWPTEADAARGVPMTDAQLDARFAYYQRNWNTRLEHLACHAHDPRYEPCRS